MLQGLIFDLDGVLTNSAKYHLGAWLAIANELGIKLTDKECEGLRGLSRMDSLDYILKIGKQELPLAVKEKLAAKKNDLFLKEVEKMTTDDILPGISELLADAKKRHLKMAIASASKNAPKILSKLGILDEFDAMVDPASLSKGKPDPEIFLKAAQAINLDNSEVISFEDAQAGVAAIKAAGQFAVGIGDKDLLIKADYLVSNTSQLKLDDIISAYEKKRGE
ncbi:MAG: beta-phosphoglucomutase [Lactobacillus sp.]|nr:beta-phosphoglucomutase [Lactobacillus sp.]